EFKKKNLSTKEHKGSRRKLKVPMLMGAIPSSCFFVWLCGEILFLKSYSSWSVMHLPLSFRTIPCAPISGLSRQFLQWRSARSTVRRLIFRGFVRVIRREVLDDRFHFSRVNRFRDVIIEAAVDRPYPILSFPVARQRDQEHVLRLIKAAQSARYLIAIQA